MGIKAVGRLSQIRIISFLEISKVTSAFSESTWDCLDQLSQKKHLENMETVLLKFLYIGNNKADTMPETRLGKRRERGEGRPAIAAALPTEVPVCSGGRG